MGLGIFHGNIVKGGSEQLRAGAWRDKVVHVRDEALLVPPAPWPTAACAISAH